MVRGDGLGQGQAVGVGIRREINGGDGLGDAVRRAQWADAGGEIEAVFETQAQGPQLSLLDAAVDGAGGITSMGIGGHDGLLTA